LARAVHYCTAEGKEIMKTKLLALALLAGGSMFAQTRFSIGVNLGGSGRGYYQSAPAYVQSIPPCPGPDYVWTDNSYWARRPYNYGYQVTTRYNNSYARGYEQNRGRSFNQGRGRDDDNRGRGNGFRNR
jgi:hypothetical protein